MIVRIPLPAALSVAALLSSLNACDDPHGASGDADAKTVASAASASSVAAPPLAIVDARAPEARKKTRGPCSHEPVVTFEDPVVEQVARRQLKQPTGPITRASLHTIRTFDVKQATMEDIDPCLFGELTAVKELYLPPGPIADLSPIKALVHLEGLGISKTAVSDLSAISAMGHMDRLDISHTPVPDLSKVASLTRLTELHLDDTPIKDLTPLAKMTLLEEVSIRNTPVESLEPLRGLTHLKKLYIAGSLVKDISPVQGIPRLKIFQQGS